ncbi:hypothetical protein CKY51_00190 [Xanthomonas maliensis]|nr:hypothetical protein CKY51_00190 [Xanthomonas maliensis]
MKISIAALIALALLAACGKNTAPVDPKQNKPPLRPHCIGRVTIGLPAEATLQWTQTADLFAIARDQSPDRKAFDDEIELRKAQLASMPHETEGHRLSDFQRFGDNLSLMLFRDSEVSTHIYKAEAYYWLGPRGYQLSGEVANEERAELQALPKLAIRIRPGRSSMETSAFCIDGAYIKDPPPSVSVNVTGELKNWPSSSFWLGVIEGSDTPNDVAADIDHELKREKGAAQDVALADPGAAADPAFPKSFDVLRSGHRALAGISGQELVWRKELKSGAIAYRFRWQSEVDHGSGMAIGLDIGDNSGVRSPPSEHEMFALWDAMLASLNAPKPR